ncbi:hypothetical protein ACTMS0_20860 [Micromonospora sp. H33]|uniref:hypothetical protein n=1 Tax=Micromonospora sp. H33 TaxID=3452215 RepID=UPI003F8C93F2
MGNAQGRVAEELQERFDGVRMGPPFGEQLGDDPDGRRGRRLGKALVQYGAVEMVQRGGSSLSVSELQCVQVLRRVGGPAVRVPEATPVNAHRGVIRVPPAPISAPVDPNARRLPQRWRP